MFGCDVTFLLHTVAPQPTPHPPPSVVPLLPLEKVGNVAKLRNVFVGRGFTPAAQNDVTLLIQRREQAPALRCAEDVAPYKSTFDLPLVGEGFPLPLGNDVT